jgi:leucyl aminopeptidase
MVQIEATTGDLGKTKADAVVVNLFQGAKRPTGGTAAVDKALGGAIAHLVELGDFKGKEGQVVMLPTRGAIESARVLLIGLGKKKDFDLDTVRRVAARAALAARARGHRRIATVLHGTDAATLDTAEAAQAMTEGVILGLYRYREYKPRREDDDDEDDGTKSLEACTIVESDGRKAPAIRRGVKRGTILAECTNLTRTLINRPSIAKPPAEMARIAVGEAAKHGIKATVLAGKELEKLGLGLLVGVGAGAGKGRDPRLVILEYKGKGKKTVALVGKGITFDSGGINIKPSKGLEQMKYDMAGSATVLGALLAAARLKAPNRVIAILALAENMPSGTAIRPGDILRAYDGTTVEVGNTDAEGRLVLGDALAYAIKNHEPDYIIDAATLTGAVKIALGDITTGILGNDDAFVKRLIDQGRAIGEDVWQLPLTKAYQDQIKSSVAQIINVGPGIGGTITAAAFLKHFVDQSPKAKWAHLDIAGTCWTSKGPGELKKDYMPMGATGVGVRLIAQTLSGLR